MKLQLNLAENFQLFCTLCTSIPRQRDLTIYVTKRGFSAALLLLFSPCDCNVITIFCHFTPFWGHFTPFFGHFTPFFYFELAVWPSKSFLSSSSHKFPRFFLVISKKSSPQRDVIICNTCLEEKLSGVDLLLFSCSFSGGVWNWGRCLKRRVRVRTRACASAQTWQLATFEVKFSSSSSLYRTPCGSKKNLLHPFFFWTITLFAFDSPSWPLVQGGSDFLLQSLELNGVDTSKSDPTEALCVAPERSLALHIMLRSLLGCPSLSVSQSTDRRQADFSCHWPDLRDDSCWGVQSKADITLLRGWGKRHECQNLWNTRSTPTLTETDQVSNSLDWGRVSLNWIKRNPTNVYWLKVSLVAVTESPFQAFLSISVVR